MFGTSWFKSELGHLVNVSDCPRRATAVHSGDGRDGVSKANFRAPLWRSARARSSKFRSNEIKSQRLGPWHSKNFISEQSDLCREAWCAESTLQMIQCYASEMFSCRRVTVKRVEVPDNSDTLLLVGDYISPNISKYWEVTLKCGREAWPLHPL